MRTSLHRYSMLAAALALATYAAPAAAQEKRSDTLFTVDKYLDLQQVGDPQISPDGSQIVYSRRWVNKLEDKFESSLWIMNADGTKDRFLAKGGGARWSPDGTRIAYVNEGEPRGSQVFVRWMDAEGATSQVTHVDNPIGDIGWSPDGKQIGFSMFVPVEHTWKIDMPAAPPGAKWTPAPRYVTDLHYRQDRRGFNKSGVVHLFVVSADGGTPRDLTPGDGSVGARFDGQQGGVAWDWSPDGRTIAVAAMDDPKPDTVYRRSNILAIDVATLAKRRLTSESGVWGDPAYSPDGKKIAFSGYPTGAFTYRAAEIYAMPADGGAMTRLTSLDRDPGGIIWAHDNSGVYVTVAQEGTSNAYFAPANGSGATQVTKNAHMLSLSSLSHGGVGAGVISEFTHAPNVYRIDVSKKGTPSVTQLSHVDEDLLSRIRLATEERIVAKSSGNAEVEGWIVKPPGFDPSKKYPMIMEIHGGPHGMYNVAFNPMYQNFAANGFVVLYVNPRGSTGYGSAFGNAIYHNYPGPDYDDLMAAVDLTVSKGYIDTSRMYVGGCSGGGVLSSWVIGHTDRFAAAAVRCPVIDWLSFAGHTDIPLFTYAWFEKPFWEDPKPWLEHSSLMYVGNVKTPTMLMTGQLDMRTPMPQTEEYYAALKMRGVPAVLLQFADEYHGTGSKPTNWMRTQLYMMSWYNQWPKQASAAMAGTPR